MEKRTIEQMTVTEIMDLEPAECELFLADQAEKEQDYRDEQEQAWRPL